MPKVGSQKFPYTSSGIQKAQKHARTTGQKVDMDGYKKGGSPRPSTKKVKTNWQARATGRGKSLPNIGKPTPQSGGRTARRGSSYAGESGYKHPKGIGTTSKAPLHEKRYAHKKGTRPGQKSSVQKSGLRAAQRAGVRSDAYVGKPTPQAGGRSRTYSGYKNPNPIGGGWTKLRIDKKKGGAVKKKYHHGGRVMAGQKKPKKC